jgi:hypothetical protein
LVEDGFLFAFERRHPQGQPARFGKFTHHELHAGEDPVSLHPPPVAIANGGEIYPTLRERP